MEVKDFLYNFMVNEKIDYAKKIELVSLLHNSPDINIHQLIQISERPSTPIGFNNTEKMGYFGNVWVRKVAFSKKGDRMKGHKHHHDHLSLLATGSVMVYVEGQEPKKYVSPDFIHIPAEHEHYFIPLEDRTTSFCVFALRDDEGNQTDEYDEKNNWQYGDVK